MVFQVAIYSFWVTIPVGGTIFILFEKRDMAEGCSSGGPSVPTSSSGSIVCRETLPLSCPDCYLNFTEWVNVYYSHTDKIVKFCQDHGLIKKECFCPTCGRQCRLDLNQKSWRCGFSFVKNKQKRKKCNFKVSIFNGTWFLWCIFGNSPD